jgi:hypothetical protein
MVLGQNNEGQCRIPGLYVVQGSQTGLAWQIEIKTQQVRLPELDNVIDFTDTRYDFDIIESGQRVNEAGGILAISQVCPKQPNPPLP